HARHYQLAAGGGAVGLAIADAAHVDVEQVDLGVGGDALAVGREGDRDVANAVAVGDRDRAADQVELQATRPFRQGVEGVTAVLERLGVGEQFAAVGNGVPLLGQQHQARAAGGRLLDQ